MNRSGYPLKFQIDEIILRSIDEDLNTGDATTDALIPTDISTEASIVSKDEGILAGGNMAIEVFHHLDPAIKVNFLLDDGTRLQHHDPENQTPNSIIAKIEGNVGNILRGERIAINLLQHLSGIATQTNTFVQAIEHLPAKIVDTRKTLPGLRMLQKYAVRVGGGINHRINLADGILIKDNHIKILAREKLDLESIVNKARQHAPHPLKIEVEVESISQVKDAIKAGADILLLDNMSIKDMTEAVTIIDGKAMTEASGNIDISNVKNVAETGVDLISIGRLTHSSSALDISLDLIG